VASAGHVPSGLRGVRSDFAHFSRVHGASGFRARLRLLLASRAFWALAVYRFGRWVYERPGHPLMLAFRALYVLLFEAGRLLTKTSLSARSRIESEVLDRAPRRGLHLAGGARRPRLDASRRQHPRRRRQARSPRASAAGRARGAGSRRFRRRARAAPGRLCDRGEYAGGPLAAARSRLDRHSTETGPRRADRPSHPAAIRFAAQGGSVDVPGAPPAPPESPGA